MRSSKSGSPKDGQSKNQSKETFWQKRVSQVESVLLNKNKSKQNSSKETKDKKKQHQTAGEQLECLKKALESLTQKEAEHSKRQPKDSTFDSAPPTEVENLLKNVRSDDILCYSDGKNSLIYCPSEKGINSDLDVSDERRGGSASKSTVKRSASPEPCKKIRGGEEPYHPTREVCDGKNTRGGSSNHRMSVDRRHSDRCKRDEKREPRECCRADVKKSSEKKPKWSEACKQICKKKAPQECSKTGHLSAGRGRTRSDDEESLKGRCKRRHSDVEERGKKGGRTEEKDTRSRGSQASLKRSSGRHGSRDRERHRDRNCRTEAKRSCSRSRKEDADRERRRRSHRSGTREKTEAGRSVSREPETPPKRRSSLKRTSPSTRRSSSSGYLRDSYGNEPLPPLGYPAQCPPYPNSSYPMQNGTMPAWNSTLPPISPVPYPDGSFGAQCGFMDPEFDASSIRYPQGPAMSTPIPRRNPRVGGHMDCPSGGYMETLPEHTMGSGYSQRPSMAHHSMTPLPILRGSRGPPGGPAMNASAAMSAPAMYGRSASSIPGRPVGVSFPPQSPYQGQQFPSQDRPVSTPSGGIACCNTCCRPAPCCCPTQFCVVDNPCAACADPEYYECGEHIHETPSPMCNYHRYMCERQKSAIAESTAELDNTYLRDCMPMSAPRFDKTKLHADPKGRRLQPSLSCHGLSPSQLQHPVDPQMMSLLYRNEVEQQDSFCPELPYDDGARYCIPGTSFSKRLPQIDDATNRAILNSPYPSKTDNIPEVSVFLDAGANGRDKSSCSPLTSGISNKTNYCASQNYPPAQKTPSHSCPEIPLPPNFDSQQYLAPPSCTSRSLSCKIINAFRNAAAECSCPGRPLYDRWRSENCDECQNYAPISRNTPVFSGNANVPTCPGVTGTQTVTDLTGYTVSITPIATGLQGAGMEPGTATASTPLRCATNKDSSASVPQTGIDTAEQCHAATAPASTVPESSASVPSKFDACRKLPFYSHNNDTLRQTGFGTASPYTHDVSTNALPGALPGGPCSVPPVPPTACSISRVAPVAYSAAPTTPSPCHIAASSPTTCAVTSTPQTSVDPTAPPPPQDCDNAKISKVASTQYFDTPRSESPTLQTFNDELGYTITITPTVRLPADNLDSGTPVSNTVSNAGEYSVTLKPPTSELRNKPQTSASHISRTVTDAGYSAPLNLHTTAISDTPIQEIYKNPAGQSVSVVSPSQVVPDTGEYLISVKFPPPGTQTQKHSRKHAVRGGATPTALSNGSSYIDSAGNPLSEGKVLRKQSRKCHSVKNAKAARNTVKNATKPIPVKKPRKHRKHGASKPKSTSELSKSSRNKTLALSLSVSPNFSASSTSSSSSGGSPLEISSRQLRSKKQKKPNHHKESKKHYSKKQHRRKTFRRESKECESDSNFIIEEEGTSEETSESSSVSSTSSSGCEDLQNKQTQEQLQKVLCPDSFPEMDTISRCTSSSSFKTWCRGVFQKITDKERSAQFSKKGGKPGCTSYSKSPSETKGAKSNRFCKFFSSLNSSLSPKSTQKVSNCSCADVKSRCPVHQKHTEVLPEKTKPRKPCKPKKRSRAAISSHQDHSDESDDSILKRTHKSTPETSKQPDVQKRSKKANRLPSNQVKESDLSDDDQFIKSETDDSEQSENSTVFPLKHSGKASSPNSDHHFDSSLENTQHSEQSVSDILQQSRKAAGKSVSAGSQQYRSSTLFIQEQPSQSDLIKPTRSLKSVSSVSKHLGRSIHSSVGLLSQIGSISSKNSGSVAATLKHSRGTIFYDPDYSSKHVLHVKYPQQSENVMPRVADSAFYKPGEKSERPESDITGSGGKKTYESVFGATLSEEQTNESIYGEPVCRIPRIISYGEFLQDNSNIRFPLMCKEKAIEERMANARTSFYNYLTSAEKDELREKLCGIGHQARRETGQKEHTLDQSKQSIDYIRQSTDQKR
nr:PREDICTED: flocculation protein FLO11-like isoform X2 [Bemisia tabaci]